MAQLFTPFRIGSLTLENRLVRSATWEGMAEHDGTVTDRLVGIYEALADGGVGLILSSYLTVHPQGRQNADQIGAHEDRHVEGLTRLAAAVHSRGGKLVGQIVHCGGQSRRAAMGGLDPLAPSAVESPGYPEVPEALSREQIAEVIESFAAAAGRLVEAGFDGVQLHAAHGYLLSEFLSPSRNVRTDQYGGSLENRARFGLETYRAVRERVGGDLPVLVKLNSHDFMPGSTTEQDSLHLAQQLVAEGLDAIELSGGTPGSGKALGAARPGIKTVDDEAYFLPQARIFREALPDTPLILVGGVRTPELMERILDEGVVDAFALSRPLIREPDLPKRWQAGDLSRAECISCLGCFRPAAAGEGIRCMQLYPDG
ncbi:MAG: NADH:flavin oxidoreductase [Deltaproteobacteria bacterium]|nr:NADH:flavin oxidoreductase [Deltaproteobacteria bacterium]MBW2536724.1 NADH:flavin oxidoreductase [Deltaproteobacteria bacterium]